MRALGYDDPALLRDSIKLAASKKDGFLTWSEFLDFFFLRDATPQDRMDGNDWWNKLDREGKPMAEEVLSETVDEEIKDEKGAKKTASGQVISAMQAREMADRKPVSMTPALQILQDGRAERAEREVEEEFTALAKDKAKKAPPAKKKVPEYESVAIVADYDDDSEGGGLFKREKSKNLLLAS